MEYEKQLQHIKNGSGFIAALDQSGGSTPKALENYGVSGDAYDNDEAMFGLKFEQEFENFAAKRYEENDAFFVKMFTDSGVMKSIVDMLKPIIYRKMRKKK